MNRTNEIVTYAVESKEDKDLAIAFFKEKYPGIEYIEKTDSFVYRSFLFDYFLSGISFDRKTKSFMLIDKAYGVWLFDYGDKEDRWKNFLYQMEESRERMDRISRMKQYKKTTMIGQFWRFFSGRMYS